MASVLILVGVAAVALVGTTFTNIGLGWYYQSNIPAFAPSGQTIGMIWTVIFILSAVAINLWWGEAKDHRWWQVVWLMVLNGLLNIVWSFLFFVKGWIIAATIEMVALEATIIGLIWLMWPKNKTAASLLIPYAVWVGFATFLAYSFFVAN
ncbi:MAG: TspO/MBR family protein [bacterium]